MSPEQCSRAPAYMRSDVYAMGVILFELLTGSWPFMEETRLDMFRAHITRPPPSIAETAEGTEVMPELEAVYQKALSKKAATRFATAGEMLAAIESIPTPLAWPSDQRPSLYGTVEPATIATKVPSMRPAIGAHASSGGSSPALWIALGVGGLLVVGGVLAVVLGAI
jgi:serine/threonine-protein kinase